MELEGLRISTYSDKINPNLVRFWNKWIEKTAFMSTGNCNHETWHALAGYAKCCKEDAIEFALEYLNDVGSEWPILSFVDEVIECPIDKSKVDTYIPPQSCKMLYIVFLMQYKRSLLAEKNKINDWNLCEDDNCPEDIEHIIIAFYEQSDKKFYVWTYDECPYGWNVLCNNTAFWKRVHLPKI